jgi:hypothetical protein
VVCLLDGTARADEWDAEMEWIPDIEDDVGLELHREHPDP